MSVIIAVVDEMSRIMFVRSLPLLSSPSIEFAVTHFVVLLELLPKLAATRNGCEFGVIIIDFAPLASRNRTECCEYPSCLALTVVGLIAEGVPLNADGNEPLPRKLA